ncbi:MAG: YfaP family protein [Clostridium sp.]|uniref:YfaP family protein n=1 Tax=Clostridium sp. TaxID=1506 RepID=UPI003F2D78C1
MITMNAINNPQSRPGDKYYEFEESIRTKFKSMVDNNTSIFKTNVEKELLWDTYLKNIPEEGQQHYNCNACKHFITRYANLVIVNNEGEIKSLLWDENQAPIFFKKAAKELRKVVENASIKNMFLSDERTLGIPKTGEWTHYSVKLNSGSKSLNKSRINTAGQILADKKEEFRMLNLGLLEYSTDVLNKAIDLLESGQLYRGNKFVEVVKWQKLIKESLETVEFNNIKNNFKWLAVATAPTGYCRIKSSVVGTLLEDIKDELPLESIKRRFNDKTNSSQYMRSSSEPKENAIKEAEKVIEKMGIADSLERRYAVIEEIPVEERIWESSDEQCNLKTKKSSSNGVFAKLLEKQNNNKKISEMPMTTMTWDKFSKTILPKAKKIEAKINDSNKLMALVTSLNPESENILQWNNPFSWYYHGGIDSEIKSRIEAKGGSYENNIIRCSLIWNSYTDLDIHCITPNGRHIYYGDKELDRGYLDIDMNAGGKSSITPVENIRWKNSAPNGRYKFYVDNYSDRNNGDNPFKVELQVGEKVFTYEDVADRNYRKTVFEFDYHNGEVTLFSECSTSNSVEEWNLENDSFVQVNLVTKSPNLWGENNLEQFGNHIFFILDGCKDLSEGKGRGFFNEMLVSDLRQIRKTLEAYSSMTPIEEIEYATACGLGYSNNSEWNLILRVATTDGGNKLIKIDRFD